MCGSACIQFARSHLSRDEVINKTVIEVGSLDVNGSVRAVVENLERVYFIFVGKNTLSEGAHSCQPRRVIPALSRNPEIAGTGFPLSRE